MKKTISIEGMSCGHCSGRVTKALQELDGVTDVVVNLEAKNATLEASEAVTDALLKETVEDAGYDVMGIQ